MVDCLRNHQFGCRHYSKRSRTDKHLDLYTTDPHHKHVQFAGVVSDGHRSRRSHGRHSRSHAQSSLLSVGYRSGHNQQPEVRRCGVYTDVIRSCRGVPNDSSYRANPCPKKVALVCSTPVVSVSSAHPIDASNDDKS